MAAQSLPVCDCHGAASPQHKNQRTMTPADRESGFHDTCHDTAAHDREFIMEIISLFSHSAFTFLSHCLKYFTAVNQRHSLKQTKKIFMCLVGSTQSSCIIQAQHDSHRAFFVTQVCTSVDLVSSYSLLFDHLHIFLIKSQNPSRRLKCILMGKWAHPSGYLMNYHVKAACETTRSVYDLSEKKIEQTEMPFCQIIEEVELLYFQIVWRSVCTALHWLWISSIAGSWGRPSSGRAVKVFLVLICRDLSSEMCVLSKKTKNDLPGVCEAAALRYCCVCASAFNRFRIWIIHPVCVCKLHLFPTDQTLPFAASVQYRFACSVPWQKCCRLSI